jgi:hypothetical protein
MSGPARPEREHQRIDARECAADCAPTGLSDHRNVADTSRTTKRYIRSPETEQRRGIVHQMCLRAASSGNHL